jgi:2-polyprenyl-6-methoxyphenol hydroxylase-like FAD-dependent oxidoreductase
VGYDVLVVGAGPTGLVLALVLRRLGVAVRIVDRAPGPGTTSRALVVHARTLELYRELGLADEVVARGLKFAAVNLWARGRHAARVNLGDIGEGLSPFPYIVIFPQDEHEEMLERHLAAAGVAVERGTELVGFAQEPAGVVARLRTGEGEERCSAAYLVGCDGAHSAVRDGLGIGFPGGTYERVFYVADVALRGPVANHELHVALDEADFFAAFPLKGDSVRLIGTVRPEEEDAPDLRWEDVSQQAVQRLGVSVDRVNWFSTYHVHHRVADRFRDRRVFLAGDAAHIHSPVGGQGMNTGIGDAFNLAWKLAAAIRDHALSLLDSYEPERISFARRLVATTDRAFTFVTRNGPIARGVRLGLIPSLMPRLLERPAARRFFFRVLSQIQIHYRGSALAAGKAGSVRGGDRLPWIPGIDNHAPLSLDWQVHVYGDARDELVSAARRRGIPVHTFPWRPEVARAGLAENAAYLLRPDGYIALADPAARAATLEGFLAVRLPSASSAEARPGRGGRDPALSTW